MAKSETPARDAVLVKYLNEAYGKEKQLETALKLQIGRTQRPTIKKALQDHLKVTKAQAAGLKKRIRELGGKAETGGDLPGPDVVSDVAGAATSVANKAISAAKGPVQALRGTSVADNELRNIRDCLWNEAEEIAHYDVIEAVATELKDPETVKLAKAYRKQEEQMAKVLNREVPKIVKEVIKEEVPREERPSTPRGRSTSSRSASSRSSSSRSTSSRSTASSSGSGSAGRSSKNGSSASKPAAKRTTSSRAKSTPARSRAKSGS